ncbi:hypothetical protein OROHE_001148 [Orobanche hederae]
MHTTHLQGIAAPPTIGLHHRAPPTIGLQRPDQTHRTSETRPATAAFTLLILSNSMTRGRGFSSGQRAMGGGRDSGAGRGNGSEHDDASSSHTSPRHDDSMSPPSPARFAKQEELHDEQDQILDGLPWCRTVDDERHYAVY